VPRTRLLLLVILLGAAEPLPPQGEPSGLTVFPPAVDLNGPRSRRRLGVLGEYADGRSRDLTHAAKLRTSDEAVVRVDSEGILRPVGDGQAVVTVTAAGKSAEVRVRVAGMTGEAPVHFIREVEPILTRAGCNGGGCHGAAQGKGGFRLSLFGFDPAFDYRQIVQSAKGRRIVPTDPERSLLLLKPSAQMDHGGGERLPQQSSAYEVLRRWLEDGAPPPGENDPPLKDLVVWPAGRTLIPGERQQLVIQAVWGDGRSEDVTPLARFDALNDSVAAVRPDGLVTARGPGESHVMVRFEGQAKVFRATLPYAPAPAEEPPAWNYIDEKLRSRWKELGLAPSPLADDAEFLRRLFLDALGTLPTPDEIKRFLADDRPDKRNRIIDAVLQRPEFVDFWTLKWGDWLRINRDLVSYKGMWAYHGWLRQAVRANRGVDAMVRELLTAQGSNFTEGPVNYSLTARNPEDLGEATAQLFLGVRMQCARCHHHPFEKWSQEDYCGLAAFFAQFGTKAGKLSDPSSGSDTIVFVRGFGEITHPRMDRHVPPRGLDGPPVPPGGDRRKALAEWLTAPDNAFFARNMANRYWAAVMGRGLVEPVDDLRATNPPSNPALLDALADDFIRHGYDARHLLRTIFASRAYQLGSRATPANAADAVNAHFTRRTPRRLTAEQLADALDAATGTRESYPNLPPGTRAIQLPDTRVRSYLLDVFGRPGRQAVCDCERGTQPNLAQALHLLNGDALNRKIDAPDGRVVRLVRAGVLESQLIKELYLATLSRLPDSEEMARARRWLAEAPTPREGAGDLLWVLLNCREFLFNH
jgi:hypothetical protein